MQTLNIYWLDYSTYYSFYTLAFVCKTIALTLDGLQRKINKWSFSFNSVYLCCPPDQGFITMLGDPSPVQADVKEGESLSLRAEFDAYPKPGSLSWSYNGKQLLNTTEHVITIHRRKYR